MRKQQKKMKWTWIAAAVLAAAVANPGEGSAVCLPGDTKTIVGIGDSIMKGSNPNPLIDSNPSWIHMAPMFPGFTLTFSDNRAIGGTTADDWNRYYLRTQPFPVQSPPTAKCYWAIVALGGNDITLGYSTVEYVFHIAGIVEKLLVWGKGADKVVLVKQPSYEGYVPVASSEKRAEYNEALQRICDSTDSTVGCIDQAGMPIDEFHRDTSVSDLDPHPNSKGQAYLARSSFCQLHFKFVAPKINHPPEKRFRAICKDFVDRKGNPRE